MSKWIKKLSRVGQDGFELAKAVVRNRSTDIKPVLLNHARQSNKVANSLLHVEKEVGLVRYYGVSGYMKQRLQSGSSATATSVSSKDETGVSGESDGGSVAKIAFMVTASMKKELSETLGYELDDIKKMTPLEASLILNNSISPSDVEEKLPIAKEKYEAERQKAQEKQEERMKIEEAEAEAERVRREAEASEIQQQEEKSQQMNVISAEPTPPANSTGNEDYSLVEPKWSTNDDVAPGSFFSANLLGQRDESTGWGDEWFEVVENKDGEKTRAGLYLDEKEAELGMKTRQDIADRKGIPVSFELHRISKENL